MTAVRSAGVPATLTVEYACDRRCQVEFDMENLHIRFTLGQMLVVTDGAHEAAHLATPTKVFRHRPEVLVRAGTLVGAR